MVKNLPDLPEAGVLSQRYSLEGWRFLDPCSLYRLYLAPVYPVVCFCSDCGRQVGNHGVQYVGILATHCYGCASAAAARLAEADPDCWGSPETAEATLRARLPEWLEEEDRRWRERSTSSG